MDKGAIKKFATTARKKLLAAVKQRAFELGITETETQEPEVFEDGFRINNHFFRKQEMEQRDHLIKKINQTSFEHVIDEVAYTWFNRFIAIRFMEVNDFLPTGIRMFSSLEAGKTEPDALTEVDLLIDELDLDKNYIYELQDESDNNSLFKYILIQQCNQLGKMMPLVFEEITGYTELLLPDYLFAEKSVIHDLITIIKEKDWTREVEIIGWLYQYYNAEKKDDVFADLRKNIKISKENVPAATQLFTPRWIVQYMVDNSLGRLWVDSHNDGELQEKLPYYLESAKQPKEVIKELERITNKNIDPETITFLDPCMGSGHILVYAFEVLYEIYLSQGYRDRDIPKLILENNLYGLEIDKRATQLAYFALIMKGRQYNSRMFDTPVKSNVLAITESNEITTEDMDLFIGDDESVRDDVETIVEIFKDAKLYGSIIEVPEIELSRLRVRATELKEQDHTDLFALEFIEYSLPIIERLIDQAELLQKKYDIVVTNPPYMGRKGMNPELVKYVRKYYKDASADLFAVFMEVASRFVKDHGFLGMINQHAWMFLSSYEKLRKHTLRNHQIYSMAHLGTRAFAEIGGEVVQTTSFVMRKKVIPNFVSTFIRLVGENDTNKKSKNFFNPDCYYYKKQDEFRKIPGIPIAYWASQNVINLFENNKKILDFLNGGNGMTTGKNDSFLRMWFEVNKENLYLNAKSTEDAVSSKKKWFPYIKGGIFRKWYGNLEHIVNWENDGEAIKKEGRCFLRNQSNYFKEGISWSKVTTSNFSVRYSPSGALFDVAGISLFNESKLNIELFLGFLNSNVANHLIKLLSSTINYESGTIKSLPFIMQEKNIIHVVDQNISLSKSDWDSFETSWDFKKHPFLEFKQDATKLEDAYKNWEQEAEHRFNTLKANEEELNRIFIDLYGLQNELTPDVKDKDVTVNRADQERDVKSFLSYLVGIMFGRYSLDEEGLIFAGGEFDLNNYETFKPDKDNIIPITDEMYFEDDIVGRVIKLVKLIFGEEHIEDNLEFIADTLTRKRNETARERIRRYFLKEFYKDHVRTYQKRPIYWLIDSGRQDGFKALVYLHRYKSDLLSRVRTQYLHPQVKKYDDEISRLNLTMESDVSQAEKTRARKTKEKIEKQILECQSYDQVIAHMAHQQIELDLDDGVKVNYAKFQKISVPQGEGKPALKANIFAKT